MWSALVRLWALVSIAMNVLGEDNITLEDIVNITQTWDCSRPWPTLEIMVPVAIRAESQRNDEWENILLRSLLINWPFNASKTSLRFVLDEGTQKDPLKLKFVDDRVEALTNLVGIDDFPVIHQSYFDPGNLLRFHA